MTLLEEALGKHVKCYKLKLHKITAKLTRLD